MSKNRIIIIGAGLTGLSTAFFLKRKGIDFQILEKNDRMGGSMQTFTEKGFMYESGPNTGVISNIETYTLLQELKDLVKIQYANEDAQKRYILKNNKLHALPSGLGSAIGTPLFSLKDKFRILGEPFRKPTTNENESVGDMVVRRLGKSFLDYAVDPFVSGIYAGDPSYLVTKYALPKLYALEQNYGSFIKGSIAKKKEPKTESEQKVKREIFSTVGGFSGLIQALATYVGKANISLSCGDICITPNDANEYKIAFMQNNEQETLITDKVIIASNSLSLSHLLPFVNSNELKYSNALQYADVVEIAIGFPKWDGISLDGFGALIPRKEQQDILGVLNLSATFTDRCPEGGAMFAVFMGGFSKPEMINYSDEELTLIVQHFFEKYYKISVFNPEVFRIFRQKNAIPQYGANTGKRIQELNSLMSKNPGLFVGGNSINGVGIADRIKQACMLAERV